MSQAGGLSQQVVQDPAPSDIIRPKVMRRPSHFSSSPVVAPSNPVVAQEYPALISTDAHAADAAPIHALTPALPVPAFAAQKSWQDDARFGVVMVVIVVLTNLGLMLWLPYLHHTPPAALPIAQTDAPATASGEITLYAKPPVAHAAPAGSEDTTLPLTDEHTPPTVHILGEPAASETSSQ